MAGIRVHQSPGTEVLNELVEIHGSISAAAAAYGKVSRSTFVRWMKPEQSTSGNTNVLTNGTGTGEQTSGVRITDDTATIISRPEIQGASHLTPESLLQQHGLEPDDWNYTLTVNAWDSQTARGEILTLSQLKLQCTRRLESLLRRTDRPDGWIPPKPKRNHRRADSELIAVIGDPHCPLNEADFCEATFAWLERNQPGRVYLLGDAADNSPWKRHKRNIRIDCSAQEALDSTYEYLATTRACVPNAQIRMIFGNHDYWVRDRIAESIPQLLKLKKAGGGSPVISLRDWLRLDELGIECDETEGEYHDITVKITEDLVGMHGVLSGPHGGAVKEFQSWEGASVVQGHDHKGSIVLISKRLADGTEVQRVAISAGTQARRDLGYDPKRNVCQSFATITLHTDGLWHPELAVFDPQKRCVTWRDQRHGSLNM